MSYEIYLVHHGIKGQSWGVRNGPPYPLGSGFTQKRKEKKARRRINLMNEARGKYDKAVLAKNNPELRKRVKRESNITRLGAAGVLAGSLALTAAAGSAATIAGAPLAALPFAAHTVVSAGMTAHINNQIHKLNNPDLLKKDLDKYISKSTNWLNKQGFDVSEKELKKHYTTSYYYDGAYQDTIDYGSIKTKEYKLKKKAGK